MLYEVAYHETGSQQTSGQKEVILPFNFALKDELVEPINYQHTEPFLSPVNLEVDGAGLLRCSHDLTLITRSFSDKSENDSKVSFLFFSVFHSVLASDSGSIFA